MNYYLGTRRSASRRSTPRLDFQGPRQLNNTPPPPPSNDNVKQPPGPSNDNVKQLRRVAKYARYVKYLFKFTPYGRAFKIGWWAYQQYARYADQFNLQWYSGGWYLAKYCGGRPPLFGWGQRVGPAHSANLNCLPSQAVTTWMPITASSKQADVYSRFLPYASDLVVTWRRDFSGTVTMPQWRIEPEEVPFPWPDPWKRPGQRPGVGPRPVPYPLIPSKRPDPWQPPPPNDVKPPPPKRPPERDIKFEWTPDRPPQWVSSPPERKPPRPGEKEKKFQGSPEAVQKVFRGLSKLKEGASELDDFIDVFYNSLPKKYQSLTGRKTPQKKAEHVYKNFDKIDWNKWVEEFVENYLEDKVIGKALQLSDRAAKRRGATNTTASRVWLRAGRVF